MVTKEQLIARFEKWSGLRCSICDDVGMDETVRVFSPTSVLLFFLLIYDSDGDGWRIGGTGGLGPDQWAELLHLHEG